MLSPKIRYGVPLAVFLLGTALFYLFSFNSGYGYDALEYLVIGRSLNDGYLLYDFIPSKSWGLYSLIALYLSAGDFANHCGVTALITLVFVLVVLSTVLLASRLFNYRTALMSAVLVAGCAVFMQLNFLEPEGLVYVCGLCGAYSLSRGITKRSYTGIFLAGLCIGAGFAFKTVAGFYGLAAAVFVLVQSRGREPASPLATVSQLAALAGGALLALALPALWFAADGRLSEHIQWSYIYPLMHRPATTEFLHKLYTKLLWFFVLLLGVLFLSLRKDRRRQLYAESEVRLVLLMGVMSLLALFKQQASHYVFPGAAFLSIFIARTLDVTLNRDVLSKRKVVGAVVGTFMLGALSCISVFLYLPEAFHRLTHLESFSEEHRMAAFIRMQLPPEEYALFFQHDVALYWISHRYPNSRYIPFIKIDVQEIYLMRQDPGRLERALDDPKLGLVAFSRERTGIRDSVFLKDPQSVRMLDGFQSKLTQRWERIEPGPELSYPNKFRTYPNKFWHRKAAQRL